MTHPAYATAAVEVELKWGDFDEKFEAGVKAATERASTTLRQNFGRIQQASAGSSIDKGLAKLQQNLTVLSRSARENATALETANTKATKATDRLAEATAKARAEQQRHEALVRSGKASTDQLAASEAARTKALREQATVMRQHAAAAKAAAAKPPRPDAFGADLLTRLGRASKQAEVSLPLTADGEHLRASIRAQVAAATAEIHGKIPIEPELAAAQRARLVAEVERLEHDLGKPIKKEVKVETGHGSGGADRLASSLSGVASTGARLGLISAAVAGIGGAAGAAVGGVMALAAGFGALGIAAGAGIGTAMLGIHGVMAAVKAFSAQDDASSNDAQAKAKEITSATREVASAEKEVRSAKRESRDAEHDLTQARHDALVQLRDLNRELAGSALNEKDAQLDLLEAKRDLAKLPLTNPDADAIDRARAVLRVQQAEQRLKEVQDKNQDLLEKTQQANRKGVEQTDSVVKARERVQAADDTVSESTLRLKDAQQSLHDAATKSSGSQDKAAQALAKLAPNAQAAVLALRAAKPQIDDFSNSIQNTLFAGLDGSIKQFVSGSLPLLKDGMVGISGALNGATKDFVNFTQTTDAKRGMTDVFAGARDAIVAIQPGIAGITQGLLDFASAARPAMSQVGAAAGGLLKSIGGALTDAFHSGLGTQVVQGFATMLNGLSAGLKPLLTGLMQVAAVVAPALGPLFASLGSALGSLGPTLGEMGKALAVGLVPVLPVAAKLLISLGQAVTPMIGPLSQLLQVVGTALTKAFDALAPAIGPVSQLIADVVKAAAPLLPLVAQLASMVLQAFAPAFDSVAKALTPVIEQLVTQLTPVFAQLAPVVTQIANILGAALVQALTELAPVLPGLVVAFAHFFGAFVPLLPPLTQMAASVLPMMINLFVAFAPVIQKVTEAFTWLTQNVIMPLLLPAFQQMGTGVSSAMKTGADAVTTARDVIGGAFNAMSGFFHDLGTTATSIWDGIVKTIATAVRAVGEILQKIQIPDWVPGIGGKGTGGLGKSLIEWASAHGAAAGGYATAAGIARYAGGGRAIQGPGTGTSDSILAMLGGKRPIAVSDGEFISTAAAYRNGAPLLWALNRGWVPSAQMLHALVPGFAAGGVPGEAFADSMIGTHYLMGGFSKSSIDCSGMVSATVLAALGLPPFSDRMSTVTEGSWLAAHGAQPGLGGPGDISVGWFDHGGGSQGHTALTLSDGTNVESEGQDGVVVGGDIGAASSLFDHQMHIPKRLLRGGDLGGGSSGAAAGAGGGGSGGGGAGAAAQAATGGAGPSTSLAPSPGAGGDPLGPQPTGIAAANAWAAQQDFGTAFSDWGFDALKSIVGEFADPFGLKKLTDLGLGQARTALTPQIKAADTINFYGVTDPNKIADQVQKTLKDRMTPVSETYRHG